MSQMLTSRGYALAVAALRLAAVARTERGTPMAPRPIRSAGARRKLPVK